MLTANKLSRYKKLNSGNKLFNEMLLITVMLFIPALPATSSAQNVIKTSP